jgi:hypothetical protein
LGKLKQLMYPATVKFKCPNCEGGIGYFDVVIYFGERWTKLPFRCSTCGSLLCVSSAYSWSVLLGCSLLALAVPSALRIGPWLLWLGAVILLWFVLGSLAGAYMKVLFPPKIIRYYPDDLSLNVR